MLDGIGETAKHEDDMTEGNDDEDEEEAIAATSAPADTAELFKTGDEAEVKAVALVGPSDDDELLAPPTH